MSENVFFKTGGLKYIRSIRDLELKDKNVFLRLDLNVPMKNGQITDDTRIKASLETIKYAIEKGAKLVLASHLGRPTSAQDKEFSLEPVAKKLSEYLGVEVLLLEDSSSDAAKGLLHNLKKNQIILLENIRFEPGETKDSAELAQCLASFTQVYVNDAFGASHRAHASIHALPQLIAQKGIGFLIEKEINMLDRVIMDPARPYWAILGGAKVSDKIPVIERLIDIVDGFIIGGAMAYTFLKAMGISVGKSRVEDDKVRFAKQMIERIEARRKTLLLPQDHLVTKALTDKNARLTTGQSISEDELGVDIGPLSLKVFGEALKSAKTIFWNGPMGIFETPEFSKGTFGLAKIIAENNGTKIVGGGDSAAAAEISGYANQMTHISTGGGASLEYLQGDKLPGLEVLRNKRGM